MRTSNIKLSKKQKKAWNYLFDDSTVEILYGGSAGSGKSYLGCLWIIIESLKDPESVSAICRAEMVNIQKTTLKTFDELCNNFGVTYKYNGRLNIIEFPNGSQIMLKELSNKPNKDPDYQSLGSLELSRAFVDECTEIEEKAWNILISRVRKTKDLKGFVPKVLGTCNPQKNWVKRRFHDAERDKTLSSDKKFIQALPTDNPHLADSYIRSLKNLDKITKERLLYGNWDYYDDDASLFKSDYFEKIRSETLYGGKEGIPSYSVESNSSIITVTTSSTISSTSNKMYATVDIGGGVGKDKSVCLIWKGLVIVDVLANSSSNVTDFIFSCCKYFKRYGIHSNNVIVDSTGIGFFVNDIFAKNSYKNCISFHGSAKPFRGENYLNLRNQLYFVLSETYISIDMENISVDLPKFLEDELSVVRVSQTQAGDGKMRINSKNEQKRLLGHSPDFADCCMMRMYFEMKKTGVLVSV
jgi:hypothetical protein